MRIVHVSDCYPPRTGGIESQVRDLAAHQVAAGHAVDVLTATRGADGARRSVRSEPSGVRVRRFASALTFGFPVHPLGGRLIHDALVMLRPDVVHVHAGVVSPFAHDGARAARALALPLAITWHCMLTGVEPAIRAGARLTGWRYAPVALSAVSRVAAERVSAALGREDVAVVTNGLDLAVWAPPASAPLPADLDDGPLRVVATQRLAPRKRAVPLVRAFARAATRLGEDGAGRPRALLTIAGGGSDEQAVRREVERLGIAGLVSVLGRVPREDLPTLYRGQHAFLSATELEAFGIAALEGRAAGLAVVARSRTGITEFVTDGVDGLLADDDAGLTDNLVLLASDVALRRQIVTHNRVVHPTTDFSDVVAAADREYLRARALIDAQSERGQALRGRPRSA